MYRDRRFVSQNLKTFNQIDYFPFPLKSSENYRSADVSQKYIREPKVFEIRGNRFAQNLSMLEAKLEDDHLENILKTRGGYMALVTSLSQ